MKCKNRKIYVKSHWFVLKDLQFSLTLIYSFFRHRIWVDINTAVLKVYAFCVAIYVLDKLFDADHGLLGTGIFQYP